MSNRQKLLFGLLGMVICVVAVKWFLGDGRVTLDFNNAPLAKVIKSVEWQGGIKIITNADPALPITIHLKRAPLFEAVDTLATRADGFVRLTYVGAPDGQKLSTGLAAIAVGGKPDGWKTFSSFGGFGGGMGGMAGQGGGGDPRMLEWKVSDPGDRSLQAFLNEGAQKTGATFAVPEDWNPTLGSLPEGGSTRKMAQAIMAEAKGRVQEVFFLAVRPPRPERPERGPGDGNTAGSPPNRPEVNPEWVAERVQAQIAQLPVEERPQAQKMADDMRAMWASMKNLSPEDRRAKMEEYFNRPDVQQAMDDRMAAHDAMSSPQQREQRYRSYIQHKESVKNQPPNSP